MLPRYSMCLLLLVEHNVSKSYRLRKKRMWVCQHVGQNSHQKTKVVYITFDIVQRLTMADIVQSHRQVEKLVLT